MTVIGFHVCLNVSCSLDFIFRILGSLLYCWGKVAQDKKTKKEKRYHVSEGVVLF